MLALSEALFIAALWCGGAYHPDLGTNFAPCDGFQRPGVNQIQSPGDGSDGSAGDAAAADAAPAADAPAGDGCPR
jgi:hypothetical protein